MDQTHGVSPDSSYKSLKEKLAKFVARKSIYLLNSPAPVDLYSKKIDDTICGMGPPIEIDMQVDEVSRAEYFYASVKLKDYVIGYISSFHNAGITATLISMDDYGRARDLYHLNIKAFCPVFELKKYYQNENPMDAYSLKDRIRGQVTFVDASSKNIVMSFKNSDTNSNINLGLIDDEDIPNNYRCSKNSHPYHHQLKTSPAFQNPLNIGYLCEHFKLSDHNGHASFMNGLKGVCYSEDTFAASLRQTQINRLAIISVSKGVACVKKGNLVDAMVHLNKAIEIDNRNVEALVARGALLVECSGAIWRANTESYEIAIEDFRNGLSINPQHRNGRHYLKETLVAYAKKLASNQEYDIAVERLQEVLGMDPESTEAIYLLGRLNKFLEQKIVKAAEDWDDNLSDNPSTLENISKGKVKKVKKSKKKKEKNIASKSNENSDKRRRSSRKSSSPSDQSLSRSNQRQRRMSARYSSSRSCSPRRDEQRSLYRETDRHHSRNSRSPINRKSRYDSSRNRRRYSSSEDERDKKSTRVVVIIDKDKNNRSKKEALKKTILDIHDRKSSPDMSYYEGFNSNYKPFAINTAGRRAMGPRGRAGNVPYHRGQWRPVVHPTRGYSLPQSQRSDNRMPYNGSQPRGFANFERGRGRGRGSNRYRGFRENSARATSPTADRNQCGDSSRSWRPSSSVDISLKENSDKRQPPKKLQEMEEFLTMLKTKKTDEVKKD